MTLSEIHRVGNSVYVETGNKELQTGILKIHNFDENDTIPVMSPLVIFEPSFQTSNLTNGYEIEVNNPYEFIYYDESSVVNDKISF